MDFLGIKNRWVIGVKKSVCFFKRRACYLAMAA